MTFPEWLYRWCDRRGKLPWIVHRVLWPRTHFCPEMDDLLVTPDTAESCFCGYMPEAERAESVSLEAGREPPMSEQPTDRRYDVAMVILMFALIALVLAIWW